MKSLTYLAALIAGLGIFSSCEKSEPLSYDSPAALNFEYFATASGHTVFIRTINYSFLVNPNDDHIISIPVIVSGARVDYDRPITVEAVSDSLTTAQPSWYEILPSQIAAGKLVDTVRVRVKKVEEISSGIASLHLRIKDNEHFAKGVREKQDFNLTWTNTAVMPTWGTLFRTFFSSVGSTEAYRVFVLTTGLTNFTNADLRPYGQVGAEVLGTKFGDYLKQWEIDHGSPKLHDDGANAGLPIIPRYWSKDKYQ